MNIERDEQLDATEDFKTRATDKPKRRTALEKAEERVAKIKADARKRDIKKAAELLQHAANLLTSLDVDCAPDGEPYCPVLDQIEEAIWACKREMAK